MRRVVILLFAVCLLALVGAGCGSSSKSTSSGGANSSPPAGGSTDTGASSNGGQPSNSRLAKTKFVLHAGLAFGAFHRYIYKPFKSGAFSARKKTAFLKAGLAGLFAYHEIKVARQAAQGSPLLRKLLSPLTTLQTSLQALGTKLKGGHPDPGDIQTANGAANSVRQGAGQSGVAVKDLPTPSLGG